MIQINAFVWFSGEGAMSLLAPKSAAAFWEGSFPPTGDRVIDARSRWNDSGDAATDYDRAIDSRTPESLISKIAVGRDFGVVFHDDYPVTVLPNGDDYLFLRGTDESDRLRERLDAIRAIKPTDFRFDYDIGGSRLALFDPANRYNEKIEQLVLSMDPGRYDVYDYAGRVDGTEMLLHLFRRVG